ncbi:hypothetical protein [Nocardioides pantholopis]|uniref:hypothetical protein n=1 Tax=Nocardioides pantholopis TaxID=2483798 RepID=UPI0013DE33B2|nr:hypothetical protein [Nocardioides pantholopis]
MRVTRLGAGPLVVVVAAGCGSASTEERAAPPSGPLLVSGAGSGSGDDALVAGEVRFEDGCLTLDGLPVVWPRGTTWDADAREVVLAHGDRVAMGDAVSGGGGYHDADGLAVILGERDAAMAAACAGPTNEVALFNAGDEVTRVG